MRKNKNKVTIIGRLFDHSLTIGTVKNQNSKAFGTDYITGEISVAIDDEGLNVVPVRFGYCAPTFPSGKKNNTYTILEQIMNGGKTWAKDGPDEAWIIQCDSNLEVNDFIGNDGQFVSSQRVGGGFVTLPAKLPSSGMGAIFEIDILINKATRIEADPDKNIDKDFMKISGYAFNFRNELQPFTFNLYKERGMEFFEDYGVSNSNPMYTACQGHINNQTVKVKHVIENAFDDPTVTYTERSRREWVLDGVSPNAYDLGAEGVMTTEEFGELMANRETVIAEVRQRHEARNNASAAPAASAPAESESKSAPKWNFGANKF